jgi:hypothetical protein
MFGQITQCGADFVSLALGYDLSGLQPFLISVHQRSSAVPSLRSLCLFAAN